MFSINNILEDCPMGGSISDVLSDIYVCKMEKDIVIPATQYSIKDTCMTLMYETA